MPATSDAVFAELKKLLAPYAKHFKVFEDTPETYDLEEELPYNRTMFAVLAKRPKLVRFYFYPLHVFPELRALLPASLASRVQGKCILKLDAVSAADKKALVKLVADAWQRIAAIRALDRSQPYYRKFDLDETQALIVRIAKSATVQRRAKDVQVTFATPPKKLPPLLAVRMAKPGVLRFKTITPAEHAALRLLAR